MAVDVGGNTQSVRNCDENKFSCEEKSNKTEKICDFERKFIAINNRKISYFSFGKGEKTLVFLHGWGSEAAAFLFVMKQLCAKYRVIALDFAGFGQSDYPPEDYGVKEYAADVAAFLDALNIQSATLIGHSFGTRVALEIAAFRPQMAQRLIIVDGAGLKPRRKPSYYLKVFAHKVLKKLGKKGLKGSSDYVALPENMKKVFVKVVNYDQSSILKLIKCPCAVFWGKNDNETPLYMYKRFLSDIKGSQGFLLDGGHFAFVEDRRAFCLILGAYLDETDCLI